MILNLRAQAKLYIFLMLYGLIVSCSLCYVMGLTDAFSALIPSAPLGAAVGHHHRPAAAAAGGSAGRGNRDAPG